MSEYGGLGGIHNEEWERAGKPMPTSAIRVQTGECAYDCDNDADYLVKVENRCGTAAKFRVCETCDRENRVFAKHHLPPGEGGKL